MGQVVKVPKLPIVHFYLLSYNSWEIAIGNENFTRYAKIYSNCFMQYALKYKMNFFGHAGEIE